MTMEKIMTKETAIKRIEAIMREFRDVRDDVALTMAIEALKARPKGEWIVTGRTNIYGGTEIQCPFCGDKVMVQHIEDELFCRYCGADMRGDDE